MSWCNIWYMMDCFLQSAHVTCWAQMQKQVHVIARQGSAFVDQMWLAWTVTSVEITTGKLQVEWVVRPAIVILLGLMLNSAIKWVNKLETEVAYWSDTPVLHLCMHAWDQVPSIFLTSWTNLTNAIIELWGRLYFNGNTF